LVPVDADPDQGFRHALQRSSRTDGKVRSGTIRGFYEK